VVEAWFGLAVVAAVWQPCASVSDKLF